MKVKRDALGRAVEKEIRDNQHFSSLPLLLLRIRRIECGFVGMDLSGIFAGTPERIFMGDDFPSPSSPSHAWISPEFSANDAFTKTRLEPELFGICRTSRSGVIDAEGENLGLVVPYNQTAVNPHGQTALHEDAQTIMR